MRRVLFSSFLIMLFISGPVHAQRDSLRNLFLNAESWFLFEEYSEALPLYEALLESDPGNDHLKYKVGICLLNDPYRKDRAIQYLLDASKNINPSFKEHNFRERTAPPDVLYYLGNAYLVNELLDRAIDTYEEFLEIMDREVYDEQLVRAQIQSCKNARRLRTMPVDMDLYLLDSTINNRYANVQPVVSGDGTKMAFVTKLPFYDGAFFTEKHGDDWSRPRPITQMLGFDEDVYPVALSYDGTEMIVYYDDEYVGNLYYSRMEDGVWLPAVRMNDNISTKYWESSACFTRDGETLYFTSNRKGTYGDLDIWVTHRGADGNWGVPENLGNTINTRYNEECPHISEDGNRLYFSSYGHYNMGGYDIFYSRKKEDGSWAEPVNMGYPINTTDDDLYFQPLHDGKNAYYAVYSPRGMGRHDIYYMNIYSADNPRYYSVRGTLKTEDGDAENTSLDVVAIEAGTGDTVSLTHPDREGAFSLQLKQGTYELHFTGEGYREHIRPLQITPASDKQGISLPGNLLSSLAEEEEEEEAELFEGNESRIGLRENRFEAEAGIPLVIPFTAPRGRTLVVRTYKDSMLIETDTLVAERRRMELRIIPPAGLSEVVLEMTDPDGNIHRNRLTVSGILTEDQEAQEAPGQAPDDESSVSAEETPVSDRPAPAADTLQIRSEEPGERILPDEQGDQPLPVESGKGILPRPLLILIGIAVAGFAWWIIAWWRRREKGEKQED